MTLRRGTVLGVVLCLAACSHRSYQYGPRGAEADGLTQTRQLFIQAAESKDPTPLSGRFDLSGRPALLELLRHVALQRAELEAPSRGLLLTAAVLLGGGGSAGGPFDPRELQAAAWIWLRGELARALELDASDQAALDLLLRTPRPMGEAERRSWMEERLRRTDVSGCVGGDLAVTYDADVLRHLDGPRSEVYQAWRKQVKSVSLQELSCDGVHGLLLLSRYQGDDLPRVTAWQFFSEEEWAVLEPRLRETLGR
jgi:hypothetical protein